MANNNAKKNKNHLKAFVLFVFLLTTFFGCEKKDTLGISPEPETKSDHSECWICGCTCINKNSFFINEGLVCEESDRAKLVDKCESSSCFCVSKKDGSTMTSGHSGGFYRSYRSKMIKEQSPSKSVEGGRLEAPWDEKGARNIVKEIYKEWDRDYKITKSIPFQENRVLKRFIQVLIYNEGCHFCTGTIGGVIFAYRNNNWKIESEEKAIILLGSDGVPPSGKLVKIGSDRIGILYQWDRWAQGGGYVGYVDLMARIETFKGVLAIETGYTQEPHKEKVEFIPGDNPDFYDIKISSRVYKFVNGRYKVQK